MATLSLSKRLERMSPGRRAYALNMPIHYIRARELSRLERMLTDHEFIEAKAHYGLVSELVQDYALVRRMWLDERKERQRECRIKTIMRYVEQLIAHSGDPEQDSFPAIPSAEILGDGQGSMECEPHNAAEHIGFWGKFVGKHTESIAKRSAPLFQMAYSSAESGPVVADIESVLQVGLGMKTPWLKVVNRSPFAPDPGLVRILWGAERFTEHVVMDSSGTVAASGGNSGSIWIWDLETGRAIGVLKGHRQSITALATTPNMGHIISGSRDGTIRVWKTYEGTCLSVLDSEDGRVASIAITPAGLLAVSCGDNAVRVWDLIRNECIACLEDHMISAVAITADGKRMILGGATNDDCSIYVYKTRSLTQVACLPGHEASVFSIATTPDGGCAVTGSYDRQIGIWDLENLKCLGLWCEHDGWVRAIDITPDGRFAVSGSGDGSIRLWDLENAKTIAIRGHMRPVDSLAISVDGCRCVSASSEQGLYVWNLTSNDPSIRKKEELSILTGTSNLNRRVQLLGRKTISVIGWGDGERILHDQRNAINAVDDFVSTPDLSLGVSTHLDNFVRFWDLMNGELIRSVEFDQKIRSLYLIPGRDCVLLILEDWRMELLSLQDGAILKGRKPGHKAYQFDHLLTPDSRHIVCSDDNNSICLLDLETDSISKVFSGHTEYVSNVGLLADGRKMYSEACDHTLRIWNVDAGSSICRAEEFEWQRNLALSPDSSCIAIGDGFNVKVLDYSNGETLHLLTGHKHFVRSITFSPDGRFIITCASDSTMRIWNVESGHCIASHFSDSGDMWPKIIAWPFIIVNTKSGRPSILRLENAPTLSCPIISARRLWLYGSRDMPGEWDQNLTAVCFYCGKPFKVKTDMLGLDIDCPFKDCGKGLHISSMVWDRPIL